MSPNLDHTKNIEPEMGERERKKFQMQMYATQAIEIFRRRTKNVHTTFNNVQGKKNTAPMILATRTTTTLKKYNNALWNNQCNGRYELC